MADQDKKQDEKIKNGDAPEETQPSGESEEKPNENSWLREKTMESKEVYHGSLLHVYRDVVRLAHGGESVREFIRHSGGSCVCALDDDLNVALVRQYRYPYGTDTLELPAGKIEKGETPIQTAARELREEAGLVADEMMQVGVMYPSTAYTDEVIYLYIAIGVKQGKQRLEEDEFLTVEKMFLGDAIQKVMNGEIKDGKTQLCLLKAMMVMEAMFKQNVEDIDDAGDADDI